jgi:hypothetical protein
MSPARDSFLAAGPQHLGATLKAAPERGGLYWMRVMERARGEAQKVGDLSPNAGALPLGRTWRS